MSSKTPSTKSASSLSSFSLSQQIIYSTQEILRKNLLIKQNSHSLLCLTRQTMPIFVQLIGMKEMTEEFNIKKLIMIPSNTKLTKEDILSVENIIFVIQSNMKQTKQVVEYVKEFKQLEKNPKGDSVVKQRRYFIFVMPRQLVHCRHIVQQAGFLVPQDIIMKDLPIDLIPRDEDLFSLELPHSFREIYHEGDLGALYYVARTLMKLQAMNGMIPIFQAKGDASVAIVNMMLRMQRQINSSSNLQDIPSKIHKVILFDRSIDLVTPFLTQLTYEGLVDEVYGINAGSVRYNQVHVALNSTDRVFNEIRDLNERFVGKRLKKWNHRIKEVIAKKEDLKTQSAHAVMEFASQIRQLRDDKRNLEIHVNMMTDIKSKLDDREYRLQGQIEQDILLNVNRDHSYEYIEELIHRNENLSKIVRMLCLMSIVQNGITVKKYRYFRDEIASVYGLKTLSMLNNFENMGLFCPKGSPHTRPLNMKQLDKQFELLKEEIDDELDLHNICSGYAPLTIQLLQSIEQGWNESILNTLPGNSCFYEQQSTHSKKDGKICMFWIIGGMTFGEMNAIRYLNQRKNKEMQYIVGTTNIINGNTFVSNCM